MGAGDSPAPILIPIGHHSIEVSPNRCQFQGEVSDESMTWNRWLGAIGLMVALSRTGAELLFEVFSQRYERGSILVTTNLPFDEWTEMFGSERLTGALLDRLTHHVHIIEMNGDSYRLRQSGRTASE